MKIAVHRHIIIDVADKDRYLTQEQREELSGILATIMVGRVSDGLPAARSYIVVDKAEPYAGVVGRVVAEGELRKRGLKNNGKDINSRQ